MKASYILTCITATVILMGCQVELTPFEPATADSATTQDVSNASDTNRTDLIDIDVADTDPVVPETRSNKTITLAWEAPVERENGEQLFYYEIGGYVVEYRKQTDTGVSIQTINIPADAESVELVDLEDAAYEVRVAAYDVNGLYSVFTDYKVVMAN